MSEIVATRIEIPADHPAFDGHFPGRPVLPGVALLAEVLEAGAREPRLVDCIGSAPRLAIAKFLAPVGPGASLVIAFRLGDRSIDWRIDDGSRTVATGQIARADLAASA
jgi:3-hydroxymyristoyl/3-hydroxydecanoyl-(acyl carrier protein) dehydratase